jgi:hypothetical protein
MATKIKIGHATHSATGGTTDVNSGDQLQNADGTGGEVRIEYDYDITNRDPAFTVLLRPKSAKLAENAIVYGNRYRSKKTYIDDGLNKAEILFNKGEYKKSLELTLNTIDIIEPGIYKKLLNMYEKNSK